MIPYDYRHHIECRSNIPHCNFTISLNSVLILPTIFFFRWFDSPKVRFIFKSFSVVFEVFTPIIDLHLSFRQKNVIHKLRIMRCYLYGCTLVVRYYLSMTRFGCNSTSFIPIMANNTLVTELHIDYNSFSYQIIWFI